MRELLHIAPEVANAIQEQRAVVALESTVIAHGLPRPQNLETARHLETVVRNEGGVPATIAILDGKLFAGLSDYHLQLLADGNDIKKISTRDIAVAVAQGWNGATTVASTIWIANRAGIKVFATGGIGGVHRGSLPDVSADLPELGRRKSASSEKARTLLGWSPRSNETAVLATAESLLQLGLLKASCA